MQDACAPRRTQRKSLAGATNFVARPLLLLAGRATIGGPDARARGAFFAQLPRRFALAWLGEFFLAIGGLYETRGRLDLAQKEYDAALLADPNFGPAHSAIGWLALGTQRMQDAYEAFNRALKSNEQDPRAYHGIAEYYSQKGKRESALDNFTKALKYYKDPEKKNEILNQLFQEGQMAD